MTLIALVLLPQVPNNLDPTLCLEPNDTADSLNGLCQARKLFGSMNKQLQQEDTDDIHRRLYQAMS
jgi:hypothetical protein